MKKVFIIPILIILLLVSFGIQAAEERLQISNLGPVSFNPTLNEKCELNYKLNEDAYVSIIVYSPDYDLIRIIEENLYKKKGEYKAYWDGRDLNGKVVPDEAFFFCVQATFKDKSQANIDPTVFSGGEEFDITQLKYDKENGTIGFTLAQPARVLLRVGIKNGPLMATVLDQAAKPAGNNLVYWSGHDEDNVINIQSDQNLALMATAFNLPQYSVITYGNRNYNYHQYKRNLRTAQKPRREEIFRSTRIANNYYYSRLDDRVPRFQVEFPELKNNTAKIKGELLIRISIDDDYKEAILRHRFEVILFLDGKYIYEEEEGYTPFNLTWNSKGIKPGVHYLTVNISSYAGQVGTKTIKIYVEG